MMFANVIPQYPETKPKHTKRYIGVLHGMSLMQLKGTHSLANIFITLIELLDVLDLVGGNLLGFRRLTTVVATDAIYTA